MIPVYYDFHIHSALSPCAEDDMTPNDIVGMAILNGLDAIAITDHNSFSNVQSIILAAQSAQHRSGYELLVLPGVEVSTVEEVHVICLFYDIDTASAFENELTPFFSLRPNRTDIFGNQIIYDDKDHITGEVERMLIAPAEISFDDLYELTHKHKGAFIPAHIDRDSFSVISNLGFLPPHLAINSIEISPGGVENGFDKQNAENYAGKRMIFSSDAHQLWNISEKNNYLLLPERTTKAVVDFLR